MNRDILFYLKTKRKELNITQEEIANHLGMKKETWRDIENGKSRIRLEDFLVACKFLNIDPILLIKESNQTILIVDDEQANAIAKLNKQIEQQRAIQINDNSGNIFINSNYNEVKNYNKNKKR